MMSFYGFFSMFQCSGVLRFAGSNPIHPQQNRGSFYCILRGGLFTIHLSILGLFEVLFPPPPSENKEGSYYVR